MYSDYAFLSHRNVFDTHVNSTIIGVIVQIVLNISRN